MDKLLRTAPPRDVLHTTLFSMLYGGLASTMVTLELGGPGWLAAVFGVISACGLGGILLTAVVVTLWHLPAALESASKADIVAFAAFLLFVGSCWAIMGSCHP